VSTRVVATLHLLHHTVIVCTVTTYCKHHSILPIQPVAAVVLVEFTVLPPG
jgi:hypothetical protein